MRIGKNTNITLSIICFSFFDIDKKNLADGSTRANKTLCDNTAATTSVPFYRQQRAADPYSSIGQCITAAHACPVGTYNSNTRFQFPERQTSAVDASSVQVASRRSSAVVRYPLCLC